MGKSFFKTSQFKILLFVLPMAFCLKTFSEEKPIVSSDNFYVKKPTLKSPHWPRWAHEHWVWENEGTEKSAYEFAIGFQDRGIPVGALIVDRPWDEAPTNFVPHPQTYPNMKDLIQKLHARNIKFMLWAVSLLNKNAPQYEEAKSKGYFVNNGKQIRWWAGWGSLIDYKNPDAVNWWHKRMNIALDMGIDGWKLDGIDPYSIWANSNNYISMVGNYLGAAFFKDSKNQKIWDEYRKSYYTDFYKYSSEYTGKKFVITGRPIDTLEKTNIKKPFTPYEVSFAGWVGDQEGDWSGLKAAISNMKASAEYGFISFGSDTSGFRKTVEPNGLRDKELFIRWSQLSAFNGVFENGGSGLHAPWAYDLEVLSIYRNMVKIHHSLVPYIYSSAAWAYEGRHSIYLNAHHLGIGSKNLSQWDYMFGPHLFVASLDEAQSKRKIQLPRGEWLDFFTPDSGVVNNSIQKMHELQNYPVFIRMGAIIPWERSDVLDVYSPVFTNLKFDEKSDQNKLSEGHLRISDFKVEKKLDLLIFPKKGQVTFPLYDDKQLGGLVAYDFENEKLLTIKIENIKNLGWIRVQNSQILRFKQAHSQGDALVVKHKGTAIWIDSSRCAMPCEIEVR